MCQITSKKNKERRAGEKSPANKKMIETREFRKLRQEYEFEIITCPETITYNTYRQYIEYFKGFYTGIWTMLIGEEPDGYCDTFLETAHGYKQKLEEFYKERIKEI